MNGCAGSESPVRRNPFNTIANGGGYTAVNVADNAAAAAADDEDDAVPVLPQLPTSKLMGRRAKAPTLTPLDTSVQVRNGGGPQVAEDATDGPKARRSSAIKSINIGFADLSYTVKVWRYGKWRRGTYDFICCVYAYIAFWMEHHYSHAAWHELRLFCIYYI